MYAFVAFNCFLNTRFINFFHFFPLQSRHSRSAFNVWNAILVYFSFLVCFAKWNIEKLTFYTLFWLFSLKWEWKIVRMWLDVCVTCEWNGEMFWLKLFEWVFMTWGALCNFLMHFRLFLTFLNVWFYSKLPGNFFKNFIFRDFWDFIGIFYVKSGKIKILLLVLKTRENWQLILEFSNDICDTLKWCPSLFSELMHSNF
jgi:hypothetical protein